MLQPIKTAKAKRLEHNVKQYNTELNELYAIKKDLRAKFIGETLGSVATNFLSSTLSALELTIAEVVADFESNPYRY